MVAATIISSLVRVCEGDEACVDACFFSGTLDAQADYERVEDCGQALCADAEDASTYQACLASRCRPDLLRCLPPDECRLVGGGCDATVMLLTTKETELRESVGARGSDKNGTVARAQKNVRICE